MTFNIFKLIGWVLNRYKVLWIGGAVFILIITFWSFVIEPQTIIVKRVEIEFSGLKPDSEIKIAIISDLHIGVFYMNLEKIRKIVEIVNKEKPDLIVNLGDYHSHMIRKSNIGPDNISKELSYLKARYGNYSILGNHDGYSIVNEFTDGKPEKLLSGRNTVKDIIKQANIKLLDDSFDLLNVRGNEFVLLGLTDSYSTHQNYIELAHDNNLQPRHYPNLEKIMPQLPEDLPVILLNHSPDIFPQLSDRIDLTLSGHTHGGHMNIPFFREMVVPSIYPGTYRIGHYQEGDKQLFVSAGLGGPPIRFGVLPEIVILTLRGKG